MTDTGARHEYEDGGLRFRAIEIGGVFRLQEWWDDKSPSGGHWSDLEDSDRFGACREILRLAASEKALKARVEELEAWIAKAGHVPECHSNRPRRLIFENNESIGRWVTADCTCGLAALRRVK